MDVLVIGAITTNRNESIAVMGAYPFDVDDMIGLINAINNAILVVQTIGVITCQIT